VFSKVRKSDVFFFCCNFCEDPLTPSPTLLCCFVFKGADTRKFRAAVAWVTMESDTAGIQTLLNLSLRMRTVD